MRNDPPWPSAASLPRRMGELLMRMSQYPTRAAPSGSRPQMDMDPMAVARRKYPGVDPPLQRVLGDAYPAVAGLGSRLRDSIRDSTFPGLNDPEVQENFARLGRLGGILGLNDPLSAIEGPARAMGLLGKIDDPLRAARARSQGFNVDEPLYHGTGKSFDAFDVDRAGTGAGAETERAVFLTPHKGEASYYANTYGSRDALLGEEVHFPGQPEFKTNDQVLDGANVMPLFARGKMKEIDAPYYNSGEFSEALAAARGEGFDGVRFRGVQELGFPSDQIAVFDPANIRSQFAKFDPKNIGKANLLGGLAGGGIGAALMAQTYQKRER